MYRYVQLMRPTSFPRYRVGRWCIFIMAMVLLSGCSVMEKLGLYDPGPTIKSQEPIRRDMRKPPGIYDIDEETGVQYYVSEDMVQIYELPDGTETEMVFIPGGEFIMGLNDVDPLGIQPFGRIRTVVNSYWMDQTEVTNEQYRAFLNSLDEEEYQKMLPDSVAWTRSVGLPWNVYFRDEAYSDYPVACVSWHQAKRFAEWAGKELPTETEWEYAARSGKSGRIYPWDGIYASDPRTGEHLANYAPNGDYAADGYVITSEVGTFPANNFRLYDMAGNVAEWCADAYFPSYKVLKAKEQNLITPRFMSDEEPRKIVRGGSWASESFFIGVGVRDYRMSEHASARVGFRCVKRARNPFTEAKVQESFKLRKERDPNPNIIEIEDIAAELAQAGDTTATDTAASTDGTGAATATGQDDASEFQQFFRNIGDWFNRTWDNLFGGS